MVTTIYTSEEYISIDTDVGGRIIIPDSVNYPELSTSEDTVINTISNNFKYKE